jgi:hypothetical protein
MACFKVLSLHLCGGMGKIAKNNSKDIHPLAGFKPCISLQRNNFTSMNETILEVLFGLYYFV